MIIIEEKDLSQHTEEGPEAGRTGKHKSLLFHLWDRTSKRDEKKKEAAEAAAAAAAAVPDAASETQREDVISILYDLWNQNRNPDTEKAKLLNDAVEEDYRDDFEAFERKMEDLADTILAQYGRTGEFPPSPAVVKAQASSDRLRAWAFIVGPFGDGEDITSEALTEALSQTGITFGLDAERLAKVVEGRLYFRMLAVARGVAPTNGEDGSVEELYEREEEIEIKENERGVADYKNLNLVRQVKEGTVLCRIVKPTEGMDGTSVRGEAIRGRAGKSAFVPRGSNTTLTADGSELVAAIDGHVSFLNNMFRVDKVLIIDGDVDNSVGNQDFLGDIVINGDIREGFIVKAKGNVTVKGMVENATIIAGGNVLLAKGMNGDNHGTLEAMGSVKSKFLENCTVRAAESVTAESIICCDIFSDDKVVVIGGKGVIIGGSVTAAKSIEAKNIGSKADRATTVVLGRTPNLLSREKDLRDKLRDLQKQIAEIDRDIAYLGKNTSLNDERKKKLNQHKLQKPLRQMQEGKLIAELDELREQMGSLSACRIKCATLFPPTKIVIGDAFFVVQDAFYNCNIFFADDKVVIGKGG